MSEKVIIFSTNGLISQVSLLTDGFDNLVLPENLQVQKIETDLSVEAIIKNYYFDIDTNSLKS